jgi:hypothetical protein
MADVYDCRYRALAEVLAVINGADPEELPACDQPAVFSTWLMRQKREGQEVDVYTRQCAEHDAACHGLAGYSKSVRLRAPKSDPS